MPMPPRPLVPIYIRISSFIFKILCSRVW